MTIALRTLGWTFAGTLLAAPIALAQDAGARVAVRGSVYDSTAKRPLDGAVVQLVPQADPARGKAFAALTDSAGAFRITDVSPGDYVVTFYDGRLDELSLTAALRPLRVERSDVEVALAIPGPRTVAAIHCGASERDSAAVIVGRLTRVDDSSPIAGATVRAQWFELAFGSKGLVRSTPTARVVTDATGQFVLCGLPGDASVDLWASKDRASTGTIRLDLAPSAVVAQPLSLDFGDTVASGGDAEKRHARGSARLSGVVRAPSGEAIAGARVGLRNSDVEAATDAAGRYTLAELPAGTQSVVARAIGFVPFAQPVLLLPGHASTLDVRFDSTTVVLQTVEVVGKVVFDRATLEFRKAQSRGLGFFIDRAAIDKRQPFDPSDLLYAAPGVHIGYGSMMGTGRTITVRGPQGECVPQFVIDGVSWPGEMYDLDNFIRPDEIAGMAVYRGVETPLEYRVRSGGSCGAIVIWTRKTGKVRKSGR